VIRFGERIPPVIRPFSTVSEALEFLERRANTAGLMLRDVEI